MFVFKNVICIIFLNTMFLFEKINGMENRATIKDELADKIRPRTAKNQQEQDGKILNVYSHGLGESGNQSKGRVYDYSGQKIRTRSFYTIENINRLITYIKDRNHYKIKKINLNGMSMGARVILTALENLFYAADNTSHRIRDITQKKHS
ncbi:hypothetical protein EKK58_04810 [Candidatus Dependentiae bacterium]|nr:MAG: hypothetical protein EKK58_04810 [Candidatus Dependentiae bacterium]